MTQELATEYLEYRNDLTAEYLRSIVDYNSETGLFTWRHRTDRRKEWNSRFAGTLTSASPRGSKPYKGFSINGHAYRAHRLAWLYMTGKWPKADIDHINGDPADNRWHNLREATTSQNAANMMLFSTNKTGLKGVSTSPTCVGFIAAITVNRKTKHLGVFPTKEDAHAAYCEAAKKHFGEFARTK